MCRQVQVTLRSSRQRHGSGVCAVRRILFSGLKRILGQVAAGAAGVALITGACFPAHLDFSIPAFLYLLVVLVQSLTAGFASAAIVSAIAVACLEYYFIPPILAWNINNPIDAVALVTFWATSLVITRLVTKARMEAETGECKRKDMARLYELALRLLSLEPGEAAGARSPALFREIFGFQAVSLFDAGAAGLHGDGTSRQNLAERTRAAYIAAKDQHDTQNGVDIRCLSMGAELLGAIGFEGGLGDESITGPLSLLAAVTLDRARVYERASKHAAVVHAEMLRSAILDALAHEFKTPLAAILTAAGGLRSAHNLEPDQRDLTDIIENETARLGRLTTRLLRMQRLDREEVKPNLEEIDLHTVIGSVVDQCRGQLDDREIQLRCEKEVGPVLCDQDLLSLALAQLVDNALKYSPPGSAVVITLSAEGGMASICVTNLGLPVPAEERERIFERFYRGRQGKSYAPGSGLGLYVARKIARAHGGTLTVDTAHAEAAGACFRLSLPILQRYPEHERKAS